MWYEARWVDAFYRVLLTEPEPREVVYRPTEEEAFRNLTMQANSAMRLRDLQQAKN